MHKVQKFKRFKGLSKDFQPAAAKPMGMIAADEVTDETRQKHSYGCLTEQCNAVFDWVDKYNQNESTRVIGAHFRRNRHTSHKAGCNWDLETKAFKNRAVTFFKDGFYHVRINFPLGSAWVDQNPGAYMYQGQFKKVEENKGFKSISTLGRLVKFLEKEFNSLEAPQMDHVKLHYQGQDYLWSSLFVENKNYRDNFNVAKNSGTGNTDPRLTAVKITGEISVNNKGKRRIRCLSQAQYINGVSQKVVPIVVCETNELALQLKKMDYALVAARPFFLPKLDKKKRNGHPYDRRVFLYVHDTNQVASIDKKYWHSNKGMQTAFDFDNI